MKDFIKQHYLWLIPILIFFLYIPFSPPVDLEVSRYFYQGNGQFSQSPLFAFLFAYGFYPAELTAGIALAVLLASLMAPSLVKWRKPALVLILTLGIGSGVIVHAIFKDHWGRPRPKQVTEFGGEQQFRPLYEPHLLNPIPSKSFPCGHCSIGFYFFSLAFIGWRMRNRSVFCVGLILAFGLGILLSLTRVAQGGHFVSDTIASALIMYLTAYFCDWLVN